ncbi:MAG: hypothetical protein ABI688_07760 [Bacteroidota bacterium]
MGKMLFLLLLSPALAYAQSDESIAAFLKSKPGGLGKPVILPRSDYYPRFDYAYYHTGNRDRGIMCVISSDTAYYKLFSIYNVTKKQLKNYKIENNDSFYYKLQEKYLIDSLPVFDFSKQELVMYAACGQCLAFCHHSTGEDACHRNACYLQKSWYVRDKEPLYTRKQHISTEESTVKVVE